jgi:NAD(P)-dependent dehydrogenase (short-subunit alcohol dehydrogenase family)
MLRVEEQLMSFQGKNTLVTGSSRGIGRGIALSLAERGAQVAIHYYRNQAAAQATLERVRELGSNGFLVQADVCRPDEVRRIFAQVRSEFGSLDIFVSNARTEAATFYEAPMEITLDKWDTAVDSQAKAFLVAVRCPADVEWREDCRDHIRAGRAIWKLATVGRHGRGKGSDGGAGAIFRGGAGASRHYREQYQPGMG